MKTALLTLALFVYSLCCFAQDLRMELIPWGTSQQSVQQFMLAQPGWRITQTIQATKEKPVLMVVYANEKDHVSRSFGFVNNKLMACVVNFYTNPEISSSAGENYAQDRFEPVVENIWIDRPSQTIIRRQYNDPWIRYVMSQDVTIGKKE